MSKWLYGELNAEEEGEFRELDEIWGREHQRLSDRVRRGNATLQNMIRHDALFEAYPELRGAKVAFADMEPGTRGRYDPQTNTITISEELKNAPQETLLHEIQHAIQEIEGFTGGASVDYWKEQRREITETIRAARVNLDLWLDDIGYKEHMTQSIRDVRDRKKTMEQHWKDMAEFKANSKYARQIAACEAEIAEFQKQYDEITRGMTAYEQYENTAGEIEARDTASRRDLTAEERKKTPPRLGDENTVFVEKTGISLEQELSDYPYDMQTVILDYIDSVNSEVLEFVDDVETGASWKGKKVSIGTADERMINDIWKITKTKVDPASEILISSSAIEHILKRHGKHGKADRSLSDNRDIARIPYILRNYDHAEDGENPTKAYKNKDGSPAKTVVFSKKINGTFYVVEAITDNRKIWVLSAYINKKGTSQVRDADAPRRTANTEFASVPSNIISNAEDDVKRQFSISPADDSGTPFGIFLKSSDRDIGLRGKKQMPLYANITNPMQAQNREDLARKLRGLSPEYAGVLDQIRMMDEDYHERYEAAERATFDRIAQWRKENPGARRQMREMKWKDILLVTAGISHPMAILDMADWLADHPNATLQKTMKEKVRLIEKYH